jgi:hypothetical protein
MNRTKAIGWRRVVQWGFGGQHGVMLGLPPPEGFVPPTRAAPPPAPAPAAHA